MAAPTRIVSWNINSVRFRLELVQDFINEFAPDVLCLQETKVVDDLFPLETFHQLGFDHHALHGQPMHHGVAILSKLPLHDITRHDWQANGEARHIGARLQGPAGKTIRLENVYIPAGGDVPNREENPKFGQKLDFLGRMTDWSATIDTPTILVGDFNVAPLESDVWSHKQLLKVVSHTPIEVEHLDRLKAAHNWCDLGREFYPAPQRLYSWWSYRAKDWAKSDRGRRLDHVWSSPELAQHAVAHNVAEKFRSCVKPSDHAPLITDFAI